MLVHIVVYHLHNSLVIVAYHAWPIDVPVIGVLVISMMILQFLLHGVHVCAISARHVWRAGEVSMHNAVERFRGISSSDG